MHITPSTDAVGRPVVAMSATTKRASRPSDVGGQVGLADRFDGEVDPDERGAGAGGDFEPVAAPTTGQVDQRRWYRQTQQLNDFGDAVPRQQAAGQHGRGEPEVALHDLVPTRRRCHRRVPVVEVLHPVGDVVGGHR